MPSNKKLVHLLEVLASAMEIDPRDLASAALEYANRVFNESDKDDDRRSEASAAERPTGMAASAASSYSGQLHLCLDFGTAVSKAFAWNKKSDTPVPLRIGTAAGEPASSPYGLGSRMFITRDGRVYFGQAAINHAAAVTDPESHRPLESIKDILSVGPKEGLTEPVLQEFNPSPYRITQKEIISLYLAFLTDSALIALQEDHGEANRSLPRSYTKPVFDHSRDDWATDTLAECAALGQVLADRFSGQWSAGISLEDLRSAFTQAAASPYLANVDSEFLAEPVGAFASRIRNYAPESEHRRLMMVIDVGAGTTDFAMFAAFVSDDRMRLVRIKDSVTTVRIGGDAIDDALLEFLLDKAGVTEGDARIRAIRSDLRRDIRLNKEELFTRRTITRTLINDIIVTVQLDEFEQYERMVQLRNAISKKFCKVLSDIHKSWLSFRDIHLFFTGGGGSLKMVTDLVRDQEMFVQGTMIRPRAANAVPQWIETECEELVPFYPQLAVCIGGAAYSGADTIRLIVDDELSVFHGDLGDTQWQMEGFRDGT